MKILGKVIIFPKEKIENPQLKETITKEIKMEVW
jgi:hypothetical protein